MSESGKSNNNSNNNSNSKNYRKDDSFYKIISDYYFNAGFTLSKGTIEILNNYVKNTAFHNFFKD